MKDGVCVKAWRDMCDAGRLTALADSLYLLSCYLYVLLILISFEHCYIQGNIAINSASK